MTSKRQSFLMSLPTPSWSMALLIVGDLVQVSLRGDDLLIQKPNGKELKTKIIKRARAQ
jgi:hypothetical protein